MKGKKKSIVSKKKSIVSKIIVLTGIAVVFIIFLLNRQRRYEQSMFKQTILDKFEIYCEGFINCLSLSIKELVGYLGLPILGLGFVIFLYYKNTYKKRGKNK